VVVKTKSTTRKHDPVVRRRPAALKDLLPHVRIVTDPKKLAFLKAEAAKQNRMA
jgi:hypothetical protein